MPPGSLAVRFGNCCGIMKMLLAAPEPSACSSWQSRQPTDPWWAFIVPWQVAQMDVRDLVGVREENRGSGVAANILAARVSGATYGESCLALTVWQLVQLKFSALPALEVFMPWPCVSKLLLWSPL